MEELQAGKRAFSRVGFAMLAFVAVTVVLQLVGARVFAQSLENDWLQYMLAVLPQYLIAMPLAALLMRRMPSTDIIKKKLYAGQIAIIVMICFAIMYAGNLVGTIINLVIGLFTQSEMTNLLQEVIAGSSIWANLVFVVLLAPVMEELFFRRLLIPKLSVYGEKPAVIISALVFGLIHGNLSQFFYAFGLGLAFGYIFVRTGKVIYTIMLHMFINLLSGVVSLQALNAGLIVLGIYVMIVIGLAIAGVVLFFVNKKRIVMSRGLFALPMGKRAVWTNVGMILFYIGCVGVFVVTTLAMFTNA